MHTHVDLKVLYFGTPVVLIGSRNPDGTANLAPMSSAWWLDDSAMLGMGNSARTTANLRRERACVLNLAPSTLVDAVDRLAMTTGRPDVPAYKATMGYRHVADKFAVGGLTEQAGEVVDAPRVAECPIQLECVVQRADPFGAGATAFQVRVVRAHVEESLLVPGTSHVDQHAWDPLIMKFCEFFGGGTNVYPSRLATAWEIPGTYKTTPAESGTLEACSSR
jgi:flavin reductase (DIM6/NTAB) family NADH-FMN oxidoreductase RutF